MKFDNIKSAILLTSAVMIVGILCKYVLKLDTDLLILWATAMIVFNVVLWSR
jgi:hypothetical protein